MGRRRVVAISSVLSLLTAVAVSAGSVPARASADSVTLHAARVQEAATGDVRTLNAPGGGYLVVHEFGALEMVRADGQAAWQDGTQALYRDWHLTWQNPGGFTQTPQLAWGTDPLNPLGFTGAGTGLVNDVNPAAVGYLDGRLDVAVAETVGTNMTFELNCGHCSWAFDVPGSRLHMGTFVSVFDARTGRMLYHQLEPGYVTQLAIAGNRLIIGNETGDPQYQYDDIGAFGSMSTVRGLSITSGGAARQAWTYSTGVPWGRLLDLTPVQGGTAVALAWSDTPTDLGTPGPPDGHVLMFDAATGRIRWQLRTPGYPVLTAADDHRGELAVAELTDPTQKVADTLTGLRYSNGSAAVSIPEPGALPVSLTIGSATGRSAEGWVVGAVNATIVSGGYDSNGGRVTLADPARGRVLWSRTLPVTDGNPPVPGGVAVSGREVVAGTWIQVVSPTVADPVTEQNSITAFGYRTGQALWSHAGDTGDPMSLSAGPKGTVREVSSTDDVQTYAAGGAVTTGTGAGPAAFISGITASIASAHSTDLVAGDEDGDVYALDGRSLGAGTRRVLWQAALPGPVHDIVRATLHGQQVLVAAATHAVGVISARTGQVLTVIPTPGTYAYTVTAIEAGGTPAVVVPGRRLTAYALASGAKLWTHAAPPGAWFSDAAYSDGMVAAEYSNAASDASSTEMAAIGLRAATGTLAWSVKPERSVVDRGDLWGGTFASPDIRGANGDGVAFAWDDVGGDGQVAVRNIATGALLYRDSSPDLAQVTRFLATPGTGLVAVGQQGSALITPSGAQATSQAYGISATLASTPAGTYLLTAEASVSAYSTSVFTDSSASALASDSTYYSGTVISADFAGDGTDQVAEMSPDSVAYQAVNAEVGLYTWPNFDVVQNGLAVLTLAHTSAAPSRATGPRTTATAPSPFGARSATVPAGLRPVGQPGSLAPSTEPARSGTAVPAMSPADVRHTLTQASPATDPPGYSPAQIRSYLGLTGQGRGQTVAIVDAYRDQNIVSDAQQFSAQYGLPGVCGHGGAAGNCFTLRVVHQGAAEDDDWALETSLDVEWVHAIAPQARIELVEAGSDTFASLFRAVATAAAGHPAAVSMSWGLGSGEFSDETYYDHFCQVRTTVCVVSSGDYGHPGGYPAYNPSVLSVGGTTLTLGSGGSVTSEQTWQDSGGGRSWVEPEPGYQRGAQASGHREMPDVSFEADPATGVAVYDSVPYQGQTGWFQVGGTSVGAPSWSAILAHADQLRAAAGKPPLTEAASAAQRAIYSLPADVLARITTGPDNGFCPVGCTPATGYDEITGLGSPRSGIDVALAAVR